MKRFIKMVLNLFITPTNAVWLTMADRLESEVILEAGNSRQRRTQVREYCNERDLDKPWTLESLRDRKWKRVIA